MAFYVPREPLACPGERRFARHWSISETGRCSRPQDSPQPAVAAHFRTLTRIHHGDSEPIIYFILFSPVSFFIRVCYSRLGHEYSCQTTCLRIDAKNLRSIFKPALSKQFLLSLYLSGRSNKPWRKILRCMNSFPWPILQRFGSKMI